MQKNKSIRTASSLFLQLNHKAYDVQKINTIPTVSEHLYGYKLVLLSHKLKCLKNVSINFFLYISDFKMRSVLIKDAMTSAASVLVPSTAVILNGFTMHGDIILSTGRQCSTCVCVCVRVLEVIQGSQ